MKSASRRPPGPSRPLRLVGAVAAAVWGVVIASYTLLKAFVSMPGVWRSEVHQRRELRLIPLQEFFDPYIWWGPLLNLAGNIALFAPVGFLLVMLLRPSRPVRTAAIVGFGLSLAIEVLQFAFALGYSDVDDLLFNTVGATLGALLATRVSRTAQRVLAGLIVVAGIAALVPFAEAVLPLHSGA